MKHPIACLFDLDGTLIDSIPLILSCFRHTCRAHLSEVPPDDVWIAGIGTPLFTQLRQLTRGDEVLARRMADTYREHQDAHHDSLLREFPGVRETLSELRAGGHAIGVVTSKMRAPAHRGLRRNGLDMLVDVVIDAESCATHKPHPAPILAALDRLGCAPEDALYVGDAPVDIIAGRAAGVRTIAALCGPFRREQLAAERPDAFVDDVRQVPSVLTGWLRSQDAAGVTPGAAARAAR